MTSAPKSTRAASWKAIWPDSGCAAVGQPKESEAVAALDDYVQAPVGETVENLGDRRARSDLAQAAIVRQNEPELAVARQALADQLLVARLEDVQRHALRRKEHELEREEADLRHRCSA